MPKNDVSTKIMSNKTIISSENEIEKWYLRQSTKTVPLFITGKYDKQRISVFG